MNNITDKEIREAAQQESDKVKNGYQSTYEAGFIQGAKYVRREIQAQEMRVEQTNPMEIIVHDREQERKAVKFLMQQGYRFHDNSNIEQFMQEGENWYYPVKVFICCGYIDAIMINK